MCQDVYLTFDHETFVAFDEPGPATIVLAGRLSEQSDSVAEFSVPITVF